MYSNSKQQPVKSSVREFDGDGGGVTRPSNFPGSTCILMANTLCRRQRRRGGRERYKRRTDSWYTRIVINRISSYFWLLVDTSVFHPRSPTAHTTRAYSCITYIYIYTYTSHVYSTRLHRAAFIIIYIISPPVANPSTNKRAVCVSLVSSSPSSSHHVFLVINFDRVFSTLPRLILFS